MLKTLGAQVKEFKKPSILAACCTVAEVTLEISLPLVTASIIDKGIQAGNQRPRWYRYGMATGFYRCMCNSLYDDGKL